jgi:hypothetical protein
MNRILEPLLLEASPDGHKPHSRQPNLHCDRYRIGWSKSSANCFIENSFIRVPRPRYSPDLAPSDFWFFGRTKAALAGQQFPGTEDHLTGIQEFLSEIQMSELKLVLHHWMEQVRWALDNDGDYFHKSTFYDHYSFQFRPDRPMATTYRPPYIQARPAENESSR